MRKTVFLFYFLFGLSFFLSAQKVDSFRLPAEWEPQQAVWVGVFPTAHRDTVTAKIIEALYTSVQVRLNYSNETVKKEFNQFLAGFEIDTSRLQWMQDALSNVWVRDTGPIFVHNQKGQQKIIDFGWAEYGHHYVYKTAMSLSDIERGESDRRIAAALQIPTVSTPIVAEGGALETNGQGVLVSIKETALQRNPGKTLAEIEKAYLNVTGCQKMIWLNKMLLHDKTMPSLLIDHWTSTGANGHIDEAVRFVGPNTVAIASIDEEESKNNPISAVDANTLTAYCEVFKNATDVHGKPFRIIRIPSPDLNVFAVRYKMNPFIRKQFADSAVTIKDGETIFHVPAVSYMNFFISNNVVLSAAYWKEGMPLKEKKKDEAVKNILSKLFPDKKIIQINPLPVNQMGGGIHCITQQQPQ